MRKTEGDIRSRLRDLTSAGRLYKRVAMNLTVGVRALMNQMSDLAKKNGFLTARVDAKVNRRGELVLAILIPPSFADEWGPPAGFDRREAGRRARLERS